jgi:hypothetical protein
MLNILKRYIKEREKREERERERAEARKDYIVLSNVVI